MKKILILISFLLPIFISSFNKTTFLFSNKEKNIIIYLTDLDLYLDFINIFLQLIKYIGKER